MNIFRITRVVVAVVLGTTSFRSLSAEPSDAQRGAALAASVRQQRPDSPTTSRGILRSRFGNGRRQTIPVEVRVALETNQSWSTLYRVGYSDGRSEALTVLNSPDGPPQLVLRRVTPAGKPTETRPDQPAEVFVGFAGTDFWLVDLSLVFLYWPDQRWIGRETRRTRMCDMLESRNPHPVPGSYSRVVTWIDRETGGIVRGEAYDTANRLLKEFSPGSFTRVGTRYELREMEMRNEQIDSRTLLQFDIEDPDKGPSPPGR